MSDDNTPKQLSLFELPQMTKACTACKKRFPKTEEYFYRAGKSWQGRCKTCHEIFRKQWYEENKERANELSRRWNEKNHEYHKALNRKYNKEHKEKKREQHRAKRKRHPTRYQTYVNNYRAKKKKAEGEITEQLVLYLYEKQSNKCYYCNKYYKRLEIEHLTPLSRGGDNNPENIALACRACNASKSDKTEDEYYKWLENKIDL